MTLKKHTSWFLNEGRAQVVILPFLSLPRVAVSRSLRYNFVFIIFDNSISSTSIDTNYSQKTPRFLFEGNQVNRKIARYYVNAREFKNR